MRHSPGTLQHYADLLKIYFDTMKDSNLAATVRFDKLEEILIQLEKGLLSEQ